MKPRTWIPLTLIGAALAWEMYALSNEDDGDTWSELTWKASSRPLVPFAIGMLAGHFFWQRKEEEKNA